MTVVRGAISQADYHGHFGTVVECNRRDHRDPARCVAQSCDDLLQAARVSHASPERVRQGAGSACAALPSQLQHASGEKFSYVVFISSGA